MFWQGSPHLVKIERLDLLSWHKVRVRDSFGEFLRGWMYLDVSLPSQNKHAAHWSWKKRCSSVVGIWYWISNPELVNFQEHDSSLYMNIWRKSMIMTNRRSKTFHYGGYCATTSFCGCIMKIVVHFEKKYFLSYHILKWFNFTIDMGSDL